LSKNSQYLIDYLTKLRQLNKLDVEIPNQDINEIISDPRKYALDFIELEFARTVPKFIESYKNGLEFGKKNK
tara:strand:+ start:3746 stop:3961 length:216 start_codon:yes stop_codon:yes gene_type:complete